MKPSQVMLSAGAGGFLVWLGVRGSRWLKGELAYYRWRRQRVHRIILRPSEDGDGLRQRSATGAALVWDNRRDRVSS